MWANYSGRGTEAQGGRFVSLDNKSRRRAGQRFGLPSGGMSRAGLNRLSCSGWLAGLLLLVAGSAAAQSAPALSSSSRGSGTRAPASRPAAGGQTPASRSATAPRAVRPAQARTTASTSVTRQPASRPAGKPAGLAAIRPRADTQRTVERARQALRRRSRKHTWGKSLVAKLRLILPGEVRVLFGLSREPVPLPMAGARSGAARDAVYFADGGRYLLGVQIWLTPNASVGAATWSRLKRSWPRSRKTSSPGAMAFSSLVRGMRFLVLLTSRGKMVVALSCPEDQCLEQHLLRAARLVNGRG